MLKLRRKRPTTTAGFTLPEILIVVVMAGILALIAAPSWVGLVNNRRATAARDEVIQVIRQAQDQAERDRAIRTFRLTANASPPLMQVQRPTNTTPETLVSETVGGQGTPQNILRVGTSAGNNLTLTYNATGALDSLPASPTVITVVVGNSRRCVRIENLLGTMRTLDGNDCPAI